MHRSRSLMLIVSVPLFAILLAGCSGAGHSSNGGVAGSVTGAPVGSSANGSAADGKGAGAQLGSSVQQREPLQQRQVIRTATVDLTVPDVDRAAQVALAATARAGGHADSDQRSTGAAGRHAHLVLRVPAARLDDLLGQVIALGRETSRTEQGSDVTAGVADVGARVTELQISVARLQDFLRHSGSITDLLALESQLTQRQSDLQSTIAQQRALADQVSLATLTVELSPPAAGISGRASQLPGFSGALRASLHALLFSSRLLLALLGYLTPFLVVLAAAGYLGLRRRRRSRAIRPEPAGPA